MAVWTIGSLLLFTIIATLVASMALVHRLLRWATPRDPADRDAHRARIGTAASEQAPAYGTLPAAADAVGPLGGLGPDADLGDPGASSTEMHGA
jgi:hypothetical protein